MSTQLPLLPANPRRAYATLHTDSNACYDMALLVFWRLGIKRPEVLVTLKHSPTATATANHHIPYWCCIPLPHCHARWRRISQHTDIIHAIAVPERISYGTKPRWRKCGTKFAVWDQDNFDQVAYFDSDHIFSRGNNEGEKWVAM
jgi:hypothetical protein